MPEENKQDENNLKRSNTASKLFDATRIMLESESSLTQKRKQILAAMKQRRLNNYADKEKKALIEQKIVKLKEEVSKWEKIFKKSVEIVEKLTEELNELLEEKNTIKNEKSSIPENSKKEEGILKKIGAFFKKIGAFITKKLSPKTIPTSENSRVNSLRPPKSSISAPPPTPPMQKYNQKERLR